MDMVNKTIYTIENELIRVQSIGNCLIRVDNVERLAVFECPIYMR